MRSTAGNLMVSLAPDGQWISLEMEAAKDGDGGPKFAHAIRLETAQKCMLRMTPWVILFRTGGFSVNG